MKAQNLIRLLVACLLSAGVIAPVSIRANVIPNAYIVQVEDTEDVDHPDLNVVVGTHFYTVTTGPPSKRGEYEDDDYDDTHGHGTHVAGTVAALDNSLGVVGVAPGARLWAVRVFDKRGTGSISKIIKGVDWVTERAGTIEVANMSLGTHGISEALQNAIKDSVDAGVVYVVAAGNYSEDVYGDDGIFGTEDDMIPAAYPEVAAISALADSDGKPGGDSYAGFSNYSNSVVQGNPVDSPGLAIDLLFTLSNAPTSHYETTVIEVVAQGYEWDGDTPDNGFSK